MTGPLIRGDLGRAHRLLSPRVAYLIGSRSPSGEANLIPVSNVTSVSTDPQMIIVAVHRDFRTCGNLASADGFTLSVPRADQLEGVWRLGARYSRYEFPDRATKLAACGLPIAEDVSAYGPVLRNGLGWMTCRRTQRLDTGGDHGVYLAAVEEVAFNSADFDPDGVPRETAQPIMQVSGNVFATAGDRRTIPYGDQAK
ncbi:hypothetical protein GCM10010123_01640 [Pilimelia anulata]|uniref:Flavin reductase like domain-containing protein n=1 Tax=Pilimelia anulata TaxID=53371 RepID=A0A8J3AYS5_9ACTN|nr:flavin reductase family protein [Pilimelia anulata]GGJ75310.1 hypothetical protein GCM10010123_01640 [Pilimelia anulata]